MTMRFPIDRTHRLIVRALAEPGSILYVGAVSNWRNMGDALLFDAHAALLPQRLAHLPMGGRNRLAGLRFTLSSPKVLLGGGTLIGRPSYRRSLESALALAGDTLRLSMLSVGVSPAGPGGKSDTAELVRWGEVCAHFAKVRVRGPRSSAHLAALGIKAEVIGDPVLSLMSGLARSDGPRAEGTAERMSFGVNAAEVAHMDDVAPTLISAIEALARRLGRQPFYEILVAAPYDAPAAERVRSLLSAQGLPHEVRSLSGLDAGDVRTALASVDLVLAVRLHVGVVCAALGIPFVSLSYEDKCSDFVESIGAQAVGANLPSVEIDWLTSAMESALLPETAQLIAGNVARLAELQRRAADEVVTELGLP